MPSFLTSSWYSLIYVALRTNRPGIGHSLIPSLITINRCTETNTISRPGTMNTCSAKNRDRVAPAIMGPPSIRLTIEGPITGTRLAIQAPVRVLVESQHLSSERHAQCHDQEKYADDPGQFTRIFVRPE